MVVMTLGLWFAATNHCRLESVPGLEFLHCAGDTDSSKSCNGDGCETVENGFYKTESSRLIVPVPTMVAALSMIPAFALPATPAPQNQFASAPPEIPRTWQFVTRTASPPRAPSFAS